MTSRLNAILVISPYWDTPPPAKGGVFLHLEFGDPNGGLGTIELSELTVASVWELSGEVDHLQSGTAVTLRKNQPCNNVGGDLKCQLGTILS